MGKDKQILIGTYRPKYEDIFKSPNLHRCPCGEMLQTTIQDRNHWNDGHFDELVYANVEEIIEKIVANVSEEIKESLNK